jgi:hypothetical protein
MQINNNVYDHCLTLTCSSLGNSRYLRMVLTSSSVKIRLEMAPDCVLGTPSY